ncbi:hypothetical protein OYT13_16630 [Pandoraea sp. XJJ-1]|uniref:hypothetical protein n=1 Tax=Pandoraea sp. XJJ-1 TaxID=3002643 RepID=UPI00227DB7C4|nr:hypothetical protein [Pandoraea sp. XJJ-1]WAL81465.1 hypothetical protein OYT13_16630 [Pandoraea sp. XJJ-1]
MEPSEIMDMPEEDFRRHVALRMSAQDIAIAENTALTQQVADDTAFIRSAWAEGIVAVRFGCRLAAAWRFLMRSVFLPFVAPFAALYGIWYYRHFHEFPDWLSATFKFVMAVL